MHKTIFLLGIRNSCWMSNSRLLLSYFTYLVAILIYLEASATPGAKVRSNREKCKSIACGYSSKYWYPCHMMLVTLSYPFVLTCFLPDILLLFKCSLNFIRTCYAISIIGKTFMSHKLALTYLR